jgi:dTDP-4-dehydrorhamnose 3,5-epimerase
MQVEAFPIEGPKLIRLKRIEDARGFFSEIYNKSLFRQFIGDVDFVQDNFSLSKIKGVIRGLHFQSPPFAQGKLVRATRGAIFDVAVDIRRSAPTFGEFISVILCADNCSQLWVPPGFAHGFCALEPNSEVAYKVTVWVWRGTIRLLESPGPSPSKMHSFPRGTGCIRFFPRYPPISSNF